MLNFMFGKTPLRSGWLRTSVALTAIATLLALPGCSTFHPTTGNPAIGEHVRTRLTAEGQVRQAAVTGVARMSLEGNVLAVEPEQLVLVVPIPGIVPELQRSAKVADTLRILRADIVAVDVQRFSPVRSGLLAGGIVAAGVLGIALAGHVGSSEGGTEDPTNRNAFRPGIPIVRIPVGR